jgi:hypothetical protein
VCRGCLEFVIICLSFGQAAFGSFGAINANVGG